ncbi:MAG: SMC-Scp complex subunit ScpB [Erysipelotrichaceae bacterium]|jgi:segregation and condensation protein B|nr:SMC-Scp complex subunit ScpB [Erysipelotrichaceae bacterium]
MDDTYAVLEGLLFLSGDEGLTLAQLSDVLEMENDETERLLEAMMDEYMQPQRGIELVRFGGYYKFVSKESIHSYAEKLFANSKMAVLSQAALETLAIIAYKQPMTRAEIEEIRGVGCDMMIRKLMARSLIKECGRSDAPGKPFLYEVTPEFMDAFKLESLKELPELPKPDANFEEELFEE